MPLAGSRWTKALLLSLVLALSLSLFLLLLVLSPSLSLSLLLSLSLCKMPAVSGRLAKRPWSTGAWQGAHTPFGEDPCIQC